MPSSKAPRSLWRAVALTLLMPGLGHIYCGQVRRGLVVWGAVLTALLVGLYTWARWLLVPVAPLLGAAFSWGLLQLALGGDLARFVREHGADYHVGPVNHPLAYVAAFLGLAVLPLLVGCVVTATVQVGSVEVETRAMFPHLLPGDRVLFDRTAYLRHAPAEGDLVVVAWPPSGRLIARVVATGGRTVGLRDGRPIVDGRPIERGRVVGLRVPRFGTGRDAHDLAALSGYLERLGGNAYVVTYDRERAALSDPAPVVLREDELYVLGDNRDEAVRLRHFGRVRSAAIRGRPRYVWASFDPAGEGRYGRVGKEVR